MIKDRLVTSYSNKKSYVVNRKRVLEFEVGYQVYTKLSSIKGIMRFGKKEKLSKRYICPYEVLQRVGNVEYELNLPNNFASNHPLFHVLILKSVYVIQHPSCLLRG